MGLKYDIDEIKARQDRQRAISPGPRRFIPTTVHAEDVESPTSPPPSPNEAPITAPSQEDGYPASPDFAALAQEQPLAAPDFDLERQHPYGLDPVTGAQLGLNPPLIFPDPPLPPFGAQAVGISLTGQGAVYGATGRVVGHLPLPVVVQVVPERPAESWRFERMGEEDVRSLMAESRRIVMQGIPEVGAVTRGWWANMGGLWVGEGRVVRVWHNVQMLFVDM
ncbi:uncharacterized protein DSM5745_05966 [Aspergillus mulundensis]|uniref:Uncharacterized protein n=1 Tax=Aspergillus mulundensis TaxID=1810919 RepID=A0A3D8RZ30_9EURO|nr:hypothetical protein DSM5745_05966 [Aspergillus mulundensis]RDW79114.1 hypothetical protein DSM5745_05966 [Aspergillus mulundensis]